MHLKSILNRVERQKCYVYTRIRFVDEPQANSRAICSGCGKKRPGYDRLAPRRFQFVPLWNIAVFCVYAMRRVDCPECGVNVERVPWGDGKEHLTTSYRWFMARWAKRLSWKETADAFSTTWDNVFRSVQHAVEWGFAHRDLSGIDAIDVDSSSIRSTEGSDCCGWPRSGRSRTCGVSLRRSPPRCGQASASSAATC